MKKLTALFVALFATITAFSQFDESFGFINTMLHPDNSLAQALKKGGYKSLQAVGYEPDAPDTSKTVFTEYTKKFDGEGRLAEIITDNTLKTYQYDEKGRVVKYTWGPADRPAKSSFEFSYDKKKGLTNIAYTGLDKYKWIDSTGILMLVSAMDTQYFYFDKKEIRLVKHVRTYSESGWAKNFSYTAATVYNYDKKGNMTHYKMVEKSTLGDTSRIETGVYEYDKKTGLTKAAQQRYDSDLGLSDPITSDVHLFAYNKKTKTLFNHSHYYKKFYRYGGEMRNDSQFTDEMFNYSADGVLTIGTRSHDPGVVLAFIYTYGK